MNTSEWGGGPRVNGPDRPTQAAGSVPPTLHDREAKTRDMLAERMRALRMLALLSPLTVTSAIEPTCTALSKEYTNLAPVSGSSVDVTQSTSDVLPPLPTTAQFTSFGTPASACDYAGVISIGGALTLSSAGKYFGMATVIRRSIGVWVDWINTERGGITINGRKYGVRFELVDDASNTAQVIPAMATGMRSPVVANFAWGPYSSGFNRYALQQSYADGLLIMNSGSSVSSVYSINNLTFGMLPASSSYVTPIFNALVPMASAAQVSLVRTCPYDLPRTPASRPPALPST